MNQIFHPSMNVIAKASIVAIVLLLVVLGGAVHFFVRSSFMTEINVAKAQPVPFSHLHHVEQLGLDCRYCHTSVEDSSFAGIPPTETCMTCHSQVWSEAPMLEPVRQSFETGEPLEWNRVHNLSDFVFFNHSIHINKGVACQTCHGRVDKMPLTWKSETLQMEWCLNCHRNPDQFVGAKENVFVMGDPPAVEAAAEEGHGEAAAHEAMDGHALVAEYGIEVGRLDDCSICHR